jgi:hypothetical protein
MTTLTPADHYSASVHHRARAIEARRDLQQLHESAGDDKTRRRIAAGYDQVRHSLKLAEIDALLSISQRLREIQLTIEAGR